MTAKTIKGNSPTDIQKALDEIIKIDFKPTLAFIIVSNMDDAKALRSIFQIKGIAISGMTSSPSLRMVGHQPVGCDLVVDVSTNDKNRISTE